MNVRGGLVRPIFTAAVASGRFALRRAASHFTSDPVLDTILVDVDRTITVEDSPKLALQKLCGKEKAKEIMDGFLLDVLKGKISLDDLPTAVFSKLYSCGFKQSDWISIMEELDRSGGFRKELIDAILTIARATGMTSVIATRASKTSANWIARQFGFDFAIGSEEKLRNGTFDGFETIIGAYDKTSDGTRVLTKISATSEVMTRAGRSFDPKHAAVLSNDLLDALEMLRSARGILLVPQNKNSLERLTLFLRLYDVKVREDRDMKIELAGALGI